MALKFQYYLISRNTSVSNEQTEPISLRHYVFNNFLLESICGQGSLAAQNEVNWFTEVNQILIS